jgi:hypothetical protein
VLASRVLGGGVPVGSLEARFGLEIA